MGARVLALAMGLLFALAPTGVAIALPASPGTLLALPGGWLLGYATPAAVVPVGGELALLNLDIMRHNVVAYTAFGSDAQPWCDLFPAGQCPLFWSPLVELAQVSVVQGTEHLEAGKLYTYYCSIHPGMKGTLVAAPAVPS